MRYQMHSLAALSLITVVCVAAMPARAADVTLDCPAAIALGSSQFIGDVSVDTGGGALGAYTLAVTYDTRILRVDSIAGGTTREFAANPITNSADFATGRVRLAAFNTASLTSPIGIANVARITFAVINATSPSASIGIEVTTLATTDGTRIPADLQGCTVALGPPLETTPTPTAAGVTPTHSPAPTRTPIRRCVGDCGGDGAVTVEEIVVLVNIGLRSADASTCDGSDTDGNGEITVDEIVLAVKAVLMGCAPEGASS